VSNLLTYEPGRPIEEVARELGFAGADGIVKLASNENALGPSPAALEAMRNGAESMHRYPDGGCFYLKQGLARALGVTPEHILPGNGSNEILELLGHVFLQPDVNIVMAERAFIVYRLVAMAARSDIIAVAMRDFTHDLDAMAHAITAATRVVFVSNPNNPTGTMVDEAALDAFMARVPEDVIVCIDEAYIELLAPERQPDTLKYVREGRRVVIVRTFSKTYGIAGLRIGYAVADPECIELLNRVRQPFNVNAMAQQAAVAALGDTAHVDSTRRMVREGLGYLQAELDKRQIPYVPSVANFMLVEVGNGRAVFDRLQRAGVIVRAMDGYGLPGYIRVTVGLREENEAFIRALEDVLK
jgi:histidinol-phosphate aminotransferase